MAVPTEDYNSALLGEAPLDDNDKLVMRALHFISPSELNPQKDLIYGPPRPAGYVYEERSTALIFGQAWAIFFVLLFTIARLYMRGVKSRTWGLDDWVIIPGCVACVVYLGLQIASETKGCLGKHIFDCTYESAAWFVLIGEIQQPVFYFSVFCTKLSIALANRRMTGTHSPRWRVVHWIFIILFLILLPVCTLFNAFQCLPVKGNYSMWFVGTLTDPRQVTCLNRVAITISTRFVHMITDIMVFCVPIVIVSRLQLSKARRYRLIAVFAFGGVSVCASIGRVVLMFQFARDMTWDSYNMYVFNVIDITFAAIVASLPALNAALESALQHTKKYFAQHSSGRGLLSRVKGYATRPWRSRSGTSSGSSEANSTHAPRGSEETKYSTSNRHIRVLHGYGVTKEERPDRPYIVALGVPGLNDASAQFVGQPGGGSKAMRMF